MMSFMSALSVDIFAFFMTETDGPTHVTKTNLARLLISSPVCQKIVKIKTNEIYIFHNAIIRRKKNVHIKIS